MFTTFNSLVRAIQEVQVDPANNSDNEDDPTTTSSSSLQQPSEDFFDLANSVVSTVQARTNELVTSVKETDWASEIEAFKKELQEDTQHVVHTVEHSLEQLPEQAAHKDLQGTLLQVQTHITDIGRSLYVGTTDLIHQVNDAITEELQPQHPTTRPVGKVASSSRLAAGPSMRYSRLEADVSAMQRDSGTYCDEPEDTEEYRSWLAGFDLDARKPDVDQLLASNAFMAELQSRIVPLIVEYDDFWTRYFYRLHQLQSKHAQRAQVVQLAMQAQEDTVAWDDAEDADARDDDGGAAVAVEEDAAVLDDGDSCSTQDAAAEAAAAADGVLCVRDAMDCMSSPNIPMKAPSAPTVDALDAGASPPATDAGTHQSSEDTSPKAATGSDGSMDPWCVVTSPSKRQEPGPHPFAQDVPDGAATLDNIAATDGAQLTGSDIDLGSAKAGGEDESDLDEDWGLE